MYLRAEARAALAGYLEQRSTKWRDTHVFLSNQGRGISIDAIDDVVERYGALAKIAPTPPHKHLNAHRLRHTAARMLLEETGNKYHLVARMLGHSDIKTTARYLEPTQDELERAWRGSEDDE